MCLPSSIFFFLQQANLTIGSPTIEGSILEYRVLPLWPTYIYWKEDNICQSIWDDKSQLLWRTCWGNTLGNHQVLVHNRQNWSLIFSLIWTWSLLTTLSVAILWAVFLLLQFCSVAHTQQRLFFFFASTLTPLQKLAHPPKNSQCWVFYYGCSWWWW